MFIRFTCFVLFNTLLLTDTQAQAWRFPWSKDVIQLSEESKKIEVDGREIYSVTLQGKGILIEGPGDEYWDFKTGEKGKSLSLDLQYGVDTTCNIYVYRSGVFVPQDSPADFQDFINRIAQLSKNEKDSKVVFSRDASGAIEIRPPRIVKTRSVFYDPKAEVQGVLPELMGHTYYQLKYTYVDEKKTRAGTAIFIYFQTFVFCVNFESSPDNFESRLQYLENYLNLLSSIRERTDEVPRPATGA